MKGASTDAAPNSGGSLLVPVAVFLVSRAFLFGLARIAPQILTPLHQNPTYLPRTDPLARAWEWTSPWFRFDARWYVDVAEHGYQYGSAAVTNTNFFPLYPLLIRAAQPLSLGSAWFAAWLVANLAFLGALIMLWRWALSRWDGDIGLRVLLLTTCFPFAFFFAAPYAEPLFLPLAVSAFVLVEQRRWKPAALAAGLSSLTRPVGLAVVLALIVVAYRRGDRGAMFLCAAGALPFFLFALYVGILTGHPLAVAVNHSVGWVSPHGGILKTITSQFHTTLSPFDRVDAAVTVLFLGSAIAVWRLVGREYALYVAAGVLLPLAKGLVSMERYVILLFPVMAAWALWRSKVGQAAVFAISLLGLTLATCMFAVGYSIF